MVVPYRARAMPAHLARPVDHSVRRQIGVGRCSVNACFVALVIRGDFLMAMDRAVPHSHR